MIDKNKCFSFHYKKFVKENSVRRFAYSLIVPKLVGIWMVHMIHTFQNTVWLSTLLNKQEKSQQNVL